MRKVNLREKFVLFSGHWTPKIVGDLNGQQVKLVKFQGSFVRHHHDAEDELFLVIQGRFRMEFRDHAVALEEGEFLIVPRGVEHRPVADEEVWVLLFEPATTLNTGNTTGALTQATLDRLCARPWRADVGQPILAAPRPTRKPLPITYNACLNICLL